MNQCFLYRAYEADIFGVHHEISFVVTITQNTKEFVISVYCSSNFTRAKCPSDGIYLSSLMLYSHKSGRKLKLWYFRDGVELSCVAYYDTFDFNHQLDNHLDKPVKQTLPGDRWMNVWMFNMILPKVGRLKLLWNTIKANILLPSILPNWV